MNETNMSGQMESYYANGSASNNAGYYAGSALQMRLDVKEILQQAEMYLKGERFIWVDSDGNGTLDKREVWKGTQLVSQEGLQNIMNFLNMIINNATVQGNFSDTKGKTGYLQYAEFLCRTRKDLADHLMRNLKAYGIEERNYNGLISTIMRFIETFTTRLLYNEERKSYANTMKTVETSQIGGGRKSLWGF